MTVCKITMWSIGVVMLLALPGYGEYYQYIDANGVARFTDDITAVPPAKRPEVKTYVSVKNRPALSTASDRAPTEGSRAAPSSSGPSFQPGFWKDKMANQADELDRMQIELRQTYNALQKERSALSSEAPEQDMTAEERDAYHRRVERLNAGIESYEAQYADYQGRVKVFNTQTRK